MYRKYPPSRRSGAPTITEEGVVEAATARRAVVRVQKRSSCGGCSSRGSCHLADEGEMKVDVPNTLNAKAGDRVEISVPTRSLLKLSFLVYFCPILALVVGALAGDWWGRVQGSGSSLYSIVAGAVAMGLTYYVLKWVNGIVKTKGDYTPAMTRFLTNEALPQCDDNRLGRIGDSV